MYIHVNHSCEILYHVSWAKLLLFCWHWTSNIDSNFMSSIGIGTFKWSIMFTELFYYILENAAFKNHCNFDWCISQINLRLHSSNRLLTFISSYENIYSLNQFTRNTYLTIIYTMSMVLVHTILNSPKMFLLSDLIFWEKFSHKLGQVLYNTKTKLRIPQTSSLKLKLTASKICSESIVRKALHFRQESRGFVCALYPRPTVLKVIKKLAWM